MAHGRVGQVTDVMQIGDEVEVQVVGIEPDSGKIRLSRKPLLPPPTEEELAAAAARPPRRDGPGGGGDRGGRGGFGGDRDRGPRRDGGGAADVAVRDRGPRRDHDRGPRRDSGPVTKVARVTKVAAPRFNNEAAPDRRTPRKRAAAMRVGTRSSTHLLLIETPPTGGVFFIPRSAADRESLVRSNGKSSA